MRFLPEEYKKDNKISAELVLEAHRKGVTYFDTAPGYCDDRSESIMGEAFKHMKYGEFWVSTKCALWNASDSDGARRMVEQSLKRLNVPKITFYNLWCLKNMDEYRRITAKGGVYDGMLKAKEEGLVEHICCTVHASGEETAEIINDGLAEGITLGYNVLNFAYRRSGIEACHKAGKGVVVMNPLGGGTIPQYPDKFRFIAGESGDSVVTAALKFLVAHKEITVTLPGISTSAHLDEALLAVKNLPDIDGAYLEALSKKLGAELDTLCTNCAYCDVCPAGVPVPKLLEAYNETLMSDSDSGSKNMNAVKNKLLYHWGVDPKEAKDCTECGKCAELCTQKLPIIERLREISKI
jgi:hypothetical protein